MCFKNFFFRLTLCMLLAACLFATGCSGRVGVTGTVTYSDNGEPVQSGMVIFNGDKVMGRGTIKDGFYSVGFFKDGDGLAPGTYTVSADALPISAASRAMEAASFDMHGNNTAAASSPQEVYYTKEPHTLEVKRSMTFDFTVERGERPVSRVNRR